MADVKPIDSDTAAEIDLLQTERSRHLTLMRDLSVRVGFVSLSFSGLLLLAALNARGKISEISADYLTAFAEENGPEVRRALVKRAGWKAVGGSEEVQAKEDEIKKVFAILIADVASNARLPRPSMAVYLSVWISGIGIALVIRGLIHSTLAHIKVAKAIEARIIELQGRVSPVCSTFINQWPHTGVSSFTSTSEIFIGIACLTIAAEYASLLLLFSPHDASWLEVGAALPSILVAVRYFQTVNDDATAKELSHA